MVKINGAHLGWAAFLLVAIGIPLVGDQYVLSVSLNVLIFAVLAVGMNVVVGYAGLLDLGYAAFFAVGAYTTALLMIHTDASFWLIWPLSGFAAGIFGVVIGIPTLRLRTDYLAMVTLGFGEITRLSITNLDFTGGPTGLYGLREPTLFGEMLSSAGYYWLSLAMLIIGLVLSSWIRKSKLGAAWTYIRHDEEVAQAVGVNPLLAKLAAYGFGAVWGGLAGAIFVESSTAVSPTSFIFAQSLLVLMAVILGGPGSLAGAVLGACVVVGVPEVFRDAESWRMFAFGVVLIVLMIFRPEGLIRESTSKPASKALAAMTRILSRR
jgi:branched-chain amino acid transport system permease protein